MSHTGILDPPTHHRPPKVEQNGNVRIVTFTADAVRDVENMLARELEGRTAGPTLSHLLLDFLNVKYLNSLELGTLITLHTRMKALGGRLTLFNLSDQVYEVFTATRLQTLLGICREGTEQANGSGPTTAAGEQDGNSELVGDCGPADPDKFIYCE